MTLLWVAIGAGIGAPLRYLTDRAVQSRHHRGFPLGTLSVNVVGSFLLGLITALAGVLSAALLATVGTGFCGALTTYSTFSYETLALLENHSALRAAANLGGGVLAGLAAAALGAMTGGVIA